MRVDLTRAEIEALLDACLIARHQLRPHPGDQRLLEHTIRYTLFNRAAARLVAAAYRTDGAPP
jgi:hypothetical protein